MNNPNEKIDLQAQGATSSRTGAIFSGMPSIGQQQAPSVQSLATAGPASAAEPPRFRHQGPTSRHHAPQGLQPQRAMLDQRFPAHLLPVNPARRQRSHPMVRCPAGTKSAGNGRFNAFPFLECSRQSEAFRVSAAADLISHAPPSLNFNPHPERFTDHDQTICAAGRGYDVTGRRRNPVR